MSVDSKKLAHLQKLLGEERFLTLIDVLIDALDNPENTGKIKDFCDKFINELPLPTEMTVGGRTYEIVNFLQEDEKPVTGYIMAERAKEMDANLSQDDGEHILKYQDEIPVALRSKVAFVFTDWRDFKNPEWARFTRWENGRWVCLWGSVNYGCWSSHSRLLRRK